MSIDLGSQYIKIGLVKPGVPMEIVLNKESRRKTPNVITIRNGERLFAEAAAAMLSKYPQSTYQYLLSMLAQQNGDPSIALYKERFPFASFEFDETRNTVLFPSDSEKYNIEALLAMILWHTKVTTEAYAGQTVKDVVITVPIWFNQKERRALSVAADIAGLNLLQLLSDGSAAALNYGVFRRKEITETPQTMLIYDVGAAKTTATIVEYVLESERKDGKDKNPVVRTIGVGFDRTLGGLEITLRMQKHLEKIFRETVKTSKDISTNARSMGKLHKEAERVKQVLSANKETFAQIEAAHEEQNFRAKVTREDLEAMITDLEPLFVQPIKDALAMSEKSIEQIDQVVLMGAGTRMPRIQEAIKEVLGEKEIGRFLNTDEAIALGAVYQAAHLSKSFKVLPFAVHEMILYPIQVNFQSKTESGEMKDVSRVIFGFKTHYPAAKKIVSFQSYSDDFEVYLNYGNLDHLKHDQLIQLGALNLSSIAIKGVKDAISKEVTSEEMEFKGIKTSFAIDLSGVVTIAKSEVVVDRKPTEEELSTYQTELKEFEEWEKVEKARLEQERKEKEAKKKAEKEAKEKKKNADETEKDKEKENEVPETESKEPASEDEKEEPEKSSTDGDEKEKIEEKKKETKVEKKKKPTEPKTKTTKAPLEVDVGRKDLPDFTTEQITQFKEILSRFYKTEKEKHERDEAMNGLEALVYDLGIKIEDGEEFAEFLTKEEKEKIAVEVKRLRVWLEDEAGVETKTEEFISEKKILDDLSAKGHYRKKQKLEMPKAVEALDSMFNHSSVFLATALNLTNGEDPVFTETELEVLSKLIDTTTEWWTEKQEAYVKQARHEDPIVTTIDVAEKIRDLDREVKYLLNKLKMFVPKKKPEEKKKNETTEEGAEKETDKEGKDAEEATPKPDEQQEIPPTEEKTEEAAVEKEKKDHDPQEL
ncbi:hypothetical protein WR25_15173 [Diploscapter pachys]|uniref:Hypoxia up-regulated protein 1 n=1 Tax=Diploscapter pachys TaxID=2018661 RepID=A0A2A2KP45_9BILA|nr:hypothetical protein WR25_15173 [Diploscapter pachys]